MTENLPNGVDKTDRIGIGCFGFLGGLLAGWGCLVPVGVLLCFTGIGMIFGIPAIIAGLLSPFFISAILSAIGFRTGKCPYCTGNVGRFTLNVDAFDCPTCKQRIVIKDKRFCKLEF